MGLCSHPGLQPPCCPLSRGAGPKVARGAEPIFGDCSLWQGHACQCLRSLSIALGRVRGSEAWREVWAVRVCGPCQATPRSAPMRGLGAADSSRQPAAAPREDSRCGVADLGPGRGGCCGTQLRSDLVCRCPPEGADLQQLAWSRDHHGLQFRAWRLSLWMTSRTSVSRPSHGMSTLHVPPDVSAASPNATHRYGPYGPVIDWEAHLAPRGYHQTFWSTVAKGAPPGEPMDGVTRRWLAVLVLHDPGRAESSHSENGAALMELQQQIAGRRVPMHSVAMKVAHPGQRICADCLAGGGWAE